MHKILYFSLRWIFGIKLIYLAEQKKDIIKISHWNEKSNNAIIFWKFFWNDTSSKNLLFTKPWTFFWAFTVSVFAIRLLLASNYINSTWRKTEPSIETKLECQFENVIYSISYCNKIPMISNIDGLECYVLFDNNHDNNSNINVNKKVCEKY
ncbi:hypothetical protein RFI_02952 [Reticulomyxa filosa]|uniref:Uncharacterized protein n=1 Tax=Reticulomyxa filosa TaxID=46433 RepID=X6P7G4_RETFI|nr:hypothetical protein RFI_02952 [Reticulomyxa filosa]|eukprot:ETO34141.1 hypothetical protein RFI_02952 [Reticulomyxa filosa]